MNAEQLSLFGSGSIQAIREGCEYFVVISPPLVTQKKIGTMKRLLNKAVPIGLENLLSIPHISLFKKILPENDELVLARLRRAIEHLNVFTVRLNGADFFVHGARSKSLVLTIENPEPIRMIHALILREFRAPKGMTPHLTIARNIPAKYAPKINPVDYHLHDEFLCDRITVLKKAQGENNFSVLREITLRQY